MRKHCTECSRTNDIKCKWLRAGVWVGNDKICAMGVHNRDMVTSHGLALNCDIDLSWFSNIVPCGIQVKNSELKVVLTKFCAQGAGVTSLSRQLGVRTSVEDVTGSLVSHFARTFQCDVVTVSDCEVTKIISAAS